VFSLGVEKENEDEKKWKGIYKYLKNDSGSFRTGLMMSKE
jgi:hypothetical protein